jgi:hypothetical protein
MRLFKWLIQLKIKRLDGDQRIIYLANELLRAITAQGYCVRSQGNFGHVDIFIHNIGTQNDLIVETITNRWFARGKLEAPLVPEKEEA